MTNKSSVEIFIQGHGESVVFAHGTPTCSEEYSKVVSLIKNRYQCVLIDHLGFGASAKPFDGDYSISAHRKRFREALLSREVKKFHLVVHDFGGVIALPLIADKEFEVLSLTIINSWYWPLIETEPQMKSQKLLVDWGVLPFLYKYLNFSPLVLLKLGWGKHSALTKSRHDYYLSRFPTQDERQGPIGFLRALFDFKNSVWGESDGLTQIQIPVLLVWGVADKLVSIRNLERWIKIFPKAQVVKLKDVGHFVADEAPELFSEELLKFLSAVHS